MAVQVQIIAQLPGIRDCALVTEAHLNSIKGGDHGIRAGEWRYIFFGVLGDVDTLKPGDFAGLSSIDYMTLGGAGIKELPVGVFEGLTNMRRLNLGSNELTELPKGVFDGLPNLEILTLADNDLETLHKDVFDGLPKLKNLGLYLTELDTVPGGVFDDLSNLEALWLSNNDMTTLPEDAFAGLSNLELLELSYNDLTSLPDGVFDDLTNLISLSLLHNDLTELPDGAFSRLSRLDWLDLWGNDLTELPDNAFEGLSALEGLSLAHNNLSELPDGVFHDLPRLETLSLIGNELDELPDGTFEGLDKLERLVLAENPGSDFTFTAELERRGDDSVVVTVAQGSPFNMSVELSVEGANLSAHAVTVPAGSAESPAITFTPTGGNIKITVVSSEFAVPFTTAKYSGQRIHEGIRTGLGFPLVISGAEKEILERIVHHRDVTGDANAQADWEKALRTVRGESNAFTVQELETRVAGLSGTPKARWQRVLDAVKAMQTPAPTAVPVISVTAGADVTEGARAMFTLTASPAPQSPLPVTLSVAQSGDFGALPRTQAVTIPTSGTATHFVSTVNDTIDEPNGSITASLLSGSGYTVSATQGSAAVTVADDELPEVSITPGNFTIGSVISEGEAAAFTIVVQKADDWGGIELSLTITAEGDFGAWTGPLKRTLGEKNPGLNLGVYTTNDDVDEPDGTVTVTINPGEGYRVSPGQSSATVIVKDDDVAPAGSPEISITAGSDVTEGGSASFTFTADPAPKAPLPVTVDIAQSGNFAASGDTGEQTVTIPTSGTLQHSVATIDDLTGEEDGSISVTLKPGYGYNISRSQNAASVAVLDNEPSVSITSGGNVEEGDDAIFTISSNPAPTTPFTVSLSITQRGDYGVSAGTRTATIPTSGSVQHAVATTDDSIGEADGWLRARVHPGQGYTVSDTQSTARLMVLDNEPVVSVTAGGNVNEGDDVVFTISADPAPTSPMAVSLTVSQQGDYAGPGAVGAKTVIIPTSGTVQHSVPTIDDSLGKADGTISARLNSGQAYTISHTQNAASVAVSDNEPEVSVTGGGNIDEGNDAVFTISANPAPTAPMTVSLTVSQQGGYAETGAVGAKTVTIPTSGTVKHTVGTVDDDVVEPNGSVTVTLNAGSDHTLSSTQGAATVVVSDDDAPEIGITAVAVTVTEGDDARFTVTANPAPPSPLTVSLWVMQIGNHVEPGATGAQQVTIPTSGSAEHAVPTEDDAVAERNGQVIVMVSGGNGYTVSQSRISAGVVVYDNDAPKATPTPEISVSAGSGITEGGSASFTVSADPAPKAPLSVSVTVSQTGDYGVSTGTKTVMIPTGGSVSHAVATVDDKADEADGSVTLTLNAGSGYTVSSSQRAATVSVSDDDATPQKPVQAQEATTPDISVTAGGGITEGGSATFTITADPAPDAPLTANVTVTQTGDYAASGTTGKQTVTIPTVGSVSHAVATVNDDADEEDGSVTLTVNAGEGYAVLSGKGEASVAVADDDDPTGPEISVTAGADITEGGMATFTITADPAPKTALSVSITVTQTGDYGATTGTATVNIPTSGSAQHAVATVGDEADEPNGSVTLTVNAGEGYTVSDDSGAASVTVADDDDPAPDATPEISVTAEAGIAEGGSASFTVSASPAPTAPLAVSVTVIQSGEFGAAAGTKTVTIPTGGSVAHAVATTNDNTDEPDGSVTLTVNVGSGYTVSSSQPAGTVVVADDDAAAQQSCVTTDEDLLAEVEAKTRDPWNGARPDLVETFTRSYNTMRGEDDYTVAELKARPDRQTPNWQGDGPNELWQKIYKELDRLEGCRNAGTTTPAAPPEVSVTAGAGITEGGNASFTITASPAPSSALTVVLTVTQSGDYGATVGAQTVTIPTSGSVSHGVATVNDNTDEANGSVTVTLNPGSGYSVSSTQGSASVAVSDDDDPQQEQTPPPPATPEISVTAGSGITEGGSASFTVTASPAPASALTVTLTVTQTGDYGVSTGTKTVEIPVGGSKSYAVVTTNDNTDEANGSVTVTLNAGSGYTVSSNQGTASVTVADDDDPPPATPEISVTAGSGITEGGNASFTVTASPAPASALTVTLTVTQTGDYGVTTGPTTVVIPTGGSVSHAVATTNDDTDEADGSVTVTLNAGSGYTVSSSQGAAKVTVSDDDATTVTLVADADDPIAEDGGVREITLTLNRALAPGESLTAPLDVSGADADVHYTLALKEGDNVNEHVTLLEEDPHSAQDPAVVFAAGAREATLLLTASPNDDAEERAVRVAFGADERAPSEQNLSGGVTVEGDPLEVAIANDDDPPPPASRPTVTVHAASASEGDDELRFRVTLSEASDKDIRVTWWTQSTSDPNDRQARRGKDYIVFSMTITIKAGETVGYGAVWLEQDNEREGDEKFAVWLGNPNGADLAGNGTATMTIIDDD